MNTRGQWSWVVVSGLLGLSGCLDPQISSDASAATRLTQDAVCMRYCETVMPCDGMAAAPYSNTVDCQQTCLQVAEQWETFGPDCDEAHKDFMYCLSQLTCEEADTFLTYGPGYDPICGAAEQRVLDCQP